MTFEETVAMVFQPGMYETFVLALCFCMGVGISLLLLSCVSELVSALIHRYIWPGKKPLDDKEAP